MEAQHCYLAWASVWPPTPVDQFWRAVSRSLVVEDGIGATSKIALEKLQANIRTEINRCLGIVNKKTGRSEPQEIGWTSISLHPPRGHVTVPVRIFDAVPPKNALPEKKEPARVST